MGQAKQRGDKATRIGLAILRNEAEHKENLKRREVARVAEVERRTRMLPTERMRQERNKKLLSGFVALSALASSMSYKDLAENSKFVIGGRYNWKGQQERLIYLGHNFSGNGYWHQFAKVESPDVVWSEVLTSDLHHIEATNE